MGSCMPTDQTEFHSTDDDLPNNLSSCLSSFSQRAILEAKWQKAESRMQYWFDFLKTADFNEPKQKKFVQEIYKRSKQEGAEYYAIWLYSCMRTESLRYRIAFKDNWPKELLDIINRDYSKDVYSEAHPFFCDKYFERPARLVSFFEKDDAQFRAYFQNKMPPQQFSITQELINSSQSLEVSPQNSPNSSSNISYSATIDPLLCMEREIEQWHKEFSQIYDGKDPWGNTL